MPRVPLCGACRTRPCKRRAHPVNGSDFYEWCASCREMAGLDALELDLKLIEAARRGEFVHGPPTE